MTGVRHPPPFSALVRQRKGAAALEFALTFPLFIAFIFCLFAAYSLISARRAMDYGIEKALRYASVHGGGGTGGTTAVKTVFGKAASIVSADVGANSTVSVSPATFVSTNTVTVTVTYNWLAPSKLQGTDPTGLFSPITLSASGSVRVGN